MQSHLLPVCLAADSTETPHRTRKNNYQLNNDCHFNMCILCWTYRNYIKSKLYSPKHDPALRQNGVAQNVLLCSIRWRGCTSDGLELAVKRTEVIWHAQPPWLWQIRIFCKDNYYIWAIYICWRVKENDVSLRRMTTLSITSLYWCMFW